MNFDPPHPSAHVGPPDDSSQSTPDGSAGTTCAAAQANSTSSESVEKPRLHYANPFQSQVEQRKPAEQRRKRKAGLVVTDLLKLRIALDQTKSLEQACQVLAENLCNVLECNNVFVSIFKRKRLILCGFEHEDSFDLDEDLILSAQREVTIDNPAAGWPAADYWIPSAVHQNLINDHHESAVSFLMKDSNGNTVGAVTLVGDKSTCAESTEKINHVLDLVVPHLKLCQDAAQTVWERVRKSAKSKLGAGIKWTIISTLILAFFFVRVPHRIQCDMEANPVLRRYVSAPFDSVLKSSAVRAGDFVSRQDPLAHLDEDEIRLQQSSVEAEKEKFRKQKSVALAKGDALAVQQAQLEYKRLSYKNDLLQQRSRNLEITSPISGVVLTSSLEDAEGAPLTQGQVLFEIAPLEKMIFCIYVSQPDIAYVKKGMQVNVTVDGARESFQGEIKTIRPQSITFDNESVFVAEVEFDNQQAIVRPGMRGYATVIGHKQTIGWILFRKPFNYLKKITGF